MYFYNNGASVSNSVHRVGFVGPSWHHHSVLPVMHCYMYPCDSFHQPFVPTLIPFYCQWNQYRSMQPHSPLEDDQFVGMAHVLDDSQCESSTILEDNSEEIPKLVRVFCGLDSAQQSNQHDCFCNGFDYKAATELLRREPSQVRYTTYEYRKRRRNSVPEKGSGYTFSKYGGNIFLHSPLRWACIETAQEQDA